jgi:hypothetical protein
MPAEKPTALPIEFFSLNSLIKYLFIQDKLNNLRCVMFYTSGINNL